MILVSNDFPPKVGGIQNYLYELWSRLPLNNTRVITTKYPGADEFDREQDFQISRYSKILWPTPKLVRHISKTIEDLRSEVVLIDPLLPTGLIIPHVKNVQKVLIIHGAEVTLPARLAPSRRLVRRAMSQCDAVISAGHYAARELVRAIERPIQLINIPPGVDIEAFHVPDPNGRAFARKQLRNRLDVGPDTRIVMSASRLVPRKGFDMAISAMKELDEDIHLVIVGKGRDDKRLHSLAENKGVSGRVHFLGNISHAQLVETFHGSDVFTMLCRDRWGSLEAEGFGIVFLEASACGLPVVAGRSGGSSEAVIDGHTGFIVDPGSLSEVREKLRRLLDNEQLRLEFGENGRKFVEKNHSYDLLATQLLPVVQGDLRSAREFDG